VAKPSHAGSFAPAQTFRERGLNVTLGIDNYFADFFEVLRSAVIVGRIRGEDGTLMPPSAVLRMATIDGARALGLGDLGVLAAGRKADLALLDCRSPGLTPLLDPVPSVVYQAHAGSADTVMVDGEILGEGGRSARVHATALVDAAQRCAEAVWRRFVDRYGNIRARREQLN
jgi:5-methylthioadenosine/S-adenosylhomocysteine deaminase